MLSFLMGKKKRKNERSRMGNNQVVVGRGLGQDDSDFGSDERTAVTVVGNPAARHDECPDSQDEVTSSGTTFLKDVDCEESAQRFGYSVPERNVSGRVEISTVSPSIGAACREMEPVLRITRHHSFDSSSEASQSARAAAGSTDEPSESPNVETFSSKVLSELEKSRKAFLLGLLEGTIEEIYPEEQTIDRAHKAVVDCHNERNPEVLICEDSTQVGHAFKNYSKLSQSTNEEEAAQAPRSQRNEHQISSETDQNDVDVESDQSGFVRTVEPELKSGPERVDEDENYGEGSDEESGTTCGDVISSNDASDGKVTDSGLGNDENPDFDEILHTEQDDISLEEFETISCEESAFVDLTETQRDTAEAENCVDREREIEAEISESGRVGRENDVQLFELGNNCVGAGDCSGEGFGSSGGGLTLGGGLFSGSVDCETPMRDEPQVDDMLTLRNGLRESFPRSNLTLSSSSDESIGSKVKKHVRWADTVDGRSLESYDSYSSEEEDNESGDEVNGVLELVRAGNPGENTPTDEPDNEENDGDESSQSEEESESDDEENKTGADDTYTDSDITILVTESVNDAEENEDDEEEDEDEEIDEIYAEDDETEPKTEENLVDKMTRLQEELLAKAATLERAQSDLDAAVLEADKNSKKMGRLRDELNGLKQRSDDQQRLLENGSISCEDKDRLESRIADLEHELDTLRSEKHRLESRLSSLERERDEEMRMVQQAMDEAMREKMERETRYQKDFETERTLSSQRELQMLEDFEWKLRETEKNAKKKVEGAESEAAKRIQDMEARLARAEADLERLAELKLCEIELKQLKVTSSEQRRALRQVTRQFEELQVNEKILQEEVNRLRAALDKEKQTTSHLQTVHKEELAEKERKLRVRLEVQVSQITSEWEDRLRRELAKLKSDLENTYREEKIVAVDMVKMLKAQEISNLKQEWDKNAKELKQEIADYKRKLDDSETKHKHQIENAQTSSDRDALDLRRKMDKLDMEYQSRIEKLQEQHEAELNESRQEFERKITQAEATYQLQAGTTRTTIELVKQQLMNENQSRIDRLQAIHRQQMDEQWEMLDMERRNEVRCLEDRHRAALEQLRKELDEIRKAVAPSGGKHGNRQKSQVSETAKQLVIDQLNHEATNPFSCGDLGGIEAVSTGSDAEKILFAKLQQMARQANEDKAEIEKLRQRLEEKDDVKGQSSQLPQQSKQQYPPHQSRRNRKRRN